MASDSYSFSPAWELARLVRSKEVSPVELVDHFLERIDRVNGRLNAFITVAADESRAAARKAEEAVSRGDELPPSTACRWPLRPESTEGRPWGQPLKKLLGAPLNLG